VKGKYLPIFRMDAMDSELVPLLSQVRAIAKPSFHKSRRWCALQKDGSSRIDSFTHFPNISLATLEYMI
jgi:hypothetical protein